MKHFKNQLDRPWAAYTFAACAAVLLFLFLSNIKVFLDGLNTVLKWLSPVFTGIVVAYLFDPVSEFFERHLFRKLSKERSRQFWGVMVTLLCVVGLLALLLLALIPSLVQSISKLVANWGDYTGKLKDLVTKVSVFLTEHHIAVDLSNVESLLDEGLQKLVALVKDNAKTILSTLGNVGTSVSNFAFGIMFGFCFLIAKDGILRALKQIRTAVIRKNRIERDNELLSNCHRVFIRYVGCTVLDALIVGVATLIFALVMGMPYAPLIAAIVAITNVIPTFGPMIGSVISIFFLILESPVQALIYFIFSCVLQSLDGMVIKPRLFKGSLGIPGVWTLVLIVLGGKVAGMAGILLAIPFAAIFVILYRETVVPRLRRREARLNEDGDVPPADRAPETPPAESAP